MKRRTFIRATLFLALFLLPSCANWLNQITGGAPDPSNPPPPPREAAAGMIKRRVLLLKFVNRTPYGGEILSEHAASVVKDAIHQIPDLQIVAEEDVEGHENFLNDDWSFNFSLIFKKARASGISAVFAGQIEDLNLEEKGDEIGLLRTRFNTAIATIKFEIFDTGTERALVSRLSSGEVTEEHTRFFSDHTNESFDAARGNGAISKALEKSLANFSDLAKRISWVGRIAKIDMHRYYINAGEATGISLGQLLKVFGEGGPVVDPQTGMLMGMAPGRIKGILKVIDFMGRDGAVAVVHSGAGFRESDRVEVFTPLQ